MTKTILNMRILCVALKYLIRLLGPEKFICDPSWQLFEARCFIASYCSYNLYKTFNSLWTPGEPATLIMCQPESPEVNHNRIPLKHFPVATLRWRWRNSFVSLLLTSFPSCIFRRGPGILLLAFPFLLAL